ALAEVYLSANTNRIEDSAFKNCSSLLEIRIPELVNQIGYHAFSGCSLLLIYAEAESAPAGWDLNFNPNNRPIVWGYSD
ncbi:MAG: leucine-rich repeat protein, partial [Bacilli bacterium]|nr:leucine-rich repeat protein [Bacilli bacterium]